MTQPSSLQTIVIVGGGFGGVRTALVLANKKNIEVKLITPQSYFEYHPALYRSATGRSPLEVAIPLVEFFKFAKNVEIVDDAVTKVDTANRQTQGQSGSLYNYDQLVLAIGNVTEFYGIKGLEKYAYGVKTVQEALKLKRHLHEQLTQKDIEHTYVVVGAGPTGVELAAELVTYIKNIRRRHKINRKFEVCLIEAAPKVLPTMPSEFTDKIEDRLKKIGVKLILNTPVKSESIDSINLPNQHIDSHSVVWTAGTKNNPLSKSIKDLKLGKLDKIEVNEFLEAAPNVFVVGDAAATTYSGLAQTAIHDASFVADNILLLVNGRQRKTYKPKRPVYAIPVGSHWSAVLWGSLKIYGFLGWVLRRIADLRLYLLFLPNRKALTTWRYGFDGEETCPVCRG